MTRPFDPTLYAILDVEDESPAVGIDAVAAALDGGVTLLQVRGKRTTARSLWLFTRDVVRLAHPRNVPVLVNDRPDVARAGGADGVHLGQSDIPAPVIRRLWPEMVVGVSVHTMAELKRAEEGGASYVASGSLFPTGSKADATPLDHDVFSEICRASHLPVVGIGGITADRAARIIGLGARGVAVISGLWSAGDVRERAAEYRRCLASPNG